MSPNREYPQLRRCMSHSLEDRRMIDKQRDVSKDLRRVRDEVRRKALLDGEPIEAHSPPPVVKRAQAIPKLESPTPEPPPAPPDAAPVNTSWRAEAKAPRRIGGLLFRVLDRLLRPRFEAQQVFNARQVQLDNDILSFLVERSTATHRHYDGVLGIYRRHLGEIDERHMMLQEELVTHVEDLVQRIDLVLAGADRSRVSLERDLRDQRRRLQRLAASLSGSGPQRA